MYARIACPCIEHYQINLLNDELISLNYQSFAEFERVKRKRISIFLLKVHFAKEVLRDTIATFTCIQVCCFHLYYIKRNNRYMYIIY